MAGLERLPKPALAFLGAAWRSCEQTLEADVLRSHSPANMHPQQPIRAGPLLPRRDWTEGSCGSRKAVVMVYKDRSGWERWAV